MDAYEKDRVNTNAPHGDHIAHACHPMHVDPDCDASLDDIIAECIGMADGVAGWECGMQRASQCSDAFVTELLHVHGSACATAGGRADVKAIARVRIVSLAHQCVARDWHTAACSRQEGIASGEISVAARRSFKRGMFAGFLYGMADAVSRRVDGRSLVDA